MYFWASNMNSNFRKTNFSTYTQTHMIAGIVRAVSNTQDSINNTW